MGYGRLIDLEGHNPTSWQPTGKAKKKSEKNSFRQAHMYDMNCNCDGISHSLFAQTTTISKIRLLEQNNTAGLSPLHSSYPW